MAPHPAYLFLYDHELSPKKLAKHFGATAASQAQGLLLPGYVRGWNAAYQNKKGSPYPYYVDGEKGFPVGGHIALLNLIPDDGSQVWGLAVPASAEQLQAFAQRNKPYELQEVTTATQPALDGPLHVPLARPELVAHFTTTGGNYLLLPERYHKTLEAAYAHYGAQAHSNYKQTTEPCPAKERWLYG